MQAIVLHAVFIVTMAIHGDGYSPLLIEKSSSECLENSMALHLLKSRFKWKFLNGSFVSGECISKENSTHITLTTDYNSCGTMVTVTNTSVVFNNTALFKMSNYTPEVGISRIEKMVFQVMCVHDRHLNTTIDNGYKVKKEEVKVFKEAGFGTFHISLDLYKDDLFTKVFTDNPAKISMEDKLRFAIRLKTQTKDIFVSVLKCDAFPTSSRNKEKEYSLIKNKCTLEKTLTRDGNNFTMAAFTFPDHSGLYIQCGVILCREGSTDKKCTSCSNVRSRRELDETGNSTRDYSSVYTFSSQIIRIKRDGEVKSDNAFVSFIQTSGGSLLLSIILVSIVGMATITIVFKLYSNIKEDRRIKSFRDVDWLHKAPAYKT